MKADFLVLNYANMDFLVNRSQFITSLFLAREIRVKSPLPYFSSLTIFRNQYVLVFNFAAFLHDHFHCRGEQTAELALVTDTQGFQDNNQQVLERFHLLGKRVRISDRYLAVKVHPKAEIVSIALDELKLIPASLRSEVQGQGVLGIRFPGNSAIQYFIDSEIIIVNYITSAGGMPPTRGKT